jgi:hypothetical protein
MPHKMASASRLLTHPRGRNFGIRVSDRGKTRGGAGDTMPLTILSLSTAGPTRLGIVKNLSIPRAEIIQRFSNPKPSSALWWARPSDFEFPSLAHPQLLFLITERPRLRILIESAVHSAFWQRGSPTARIPVVLHRSLFVFCTEVEPAAEPIFVFAFVFSGCG